MVTLICTSCRERLIKVGDTLQCERCGALYPIIRGIPTFKRRGEDFWSSFYDEWHVRTEQAVRSQGNQNAGGSRFMHKLKAYLKRNRCFVSLHDFLYFHECRKSWFLRKCLESEENPEILDIGCGKGNHILNDFGRVAGVDVSFSALEYNKQHGQYDLLVQSDLCELPFEDDQFDAVVSVFVYGHIENKKKDLLLHEINRVLKPDGKAIMIIETDNNNFCLRFAKRHPDLYWEKVIMQYGHIGLESPQEALRRFQRNGFTVKYFIKTWGPIWSVADYLEVFDNDYVTKSQFLRLWIGLMKFVAKHRKLEIMMNFVLGIVCRLYDGFEGLDQTMGLMLIVEKAQKGTFDTPTSI